MNITLLLKKTEVTTYALTHYDEILFEKDCNKIVGYWNDKYKLSNKDFIDSYKVIKILIENKELLEPMPYDDVTMESPYYDKVINYKHLEYTISNLKKEIYTPKEEH